MTDFTEKLTKKLKEETNTGEWFDSHVSVIKVDFSEEANVDHNALAEDEATTAVINTIRVNNILAKRPPFAPDSLEAKLSITNGENVRPLTVGAINGLIVDLSDEYGKNYHDYQNHTMNQYTGTQEEFVGKVWEKVIKYLIENSDKQTIIELASVGSTPDEYINHMISELTEEE